MNNQQNRWAAVAISLFFAGLALLCGWLVPSHLHAVDAAILERAGGARATLVDRGLMLLRENNPDAARLILQTAQIENIARAGELAAALSSHPENKPILPNDAGLSPSTFVTPWVLRLENRDRALASLQTNESPALRELLRSRTLTNTVLFTPSASSSGQAFDAALSITGLLMAQNNLSSGLRGTLIERAAAAHAHADAQPFEEILMDFLSLGQRFTWGQLSAFANKINSPATLATLANQSRNVGRQLPELFSAVVLSEKPDAVAAYLNDFSRTGMTELSQSLQYGEGGLDEFLSAHARLYDSSFRQKLIASGPLVYFFRAASDYALRAPWFAPIMKWFFYTLSGFLLSAAFYFTRLSVPGISRFSRPSGFKVIRNLLFAFGFLFAVLLFSEPYLADANQKAEFAFRLHLPGAAVASGTPVNPSKHMQEDPKNLLTLLLFFIIQAIIYSVCLTKLAEIKRQNVPARVQLKLLENEEHLFDAGLYVGFAGTIVCLILISMKMIQQQSLMAAYSSTSFGIIFVSIFKIFNLRPVRRNLLMQAEAQAMISSKEVSTSPVMSTTA